MQLRYPLFAIAATVVLGLAACGGSGSSDKDDIAAAVKKASVGNDVKAKCEETTTKDFIRRAYGDVAQCRKAEKPEASDKPPTGVQVTNVKVDGDKATATVREQGGDTDGAVGTIDFRKEDGDWRINDLGVDYLRSEVEKGLDSSDQSSEAFRNPKVRACTKKALTDLSDSDLKRVAYAAISERKSSQKELAAVILPCFTQAGTGTGSTTTSFLRQKFEQGIASSLRKEGLSQTTIDCINTKLRAAVSDAEIQQTATSGGTSPPGLKNKAVVAIKACRGG